MDLKTLTYEERSALTALARSPGWALLVEKLLLPQIQLATRFLDRPAAEQSGRADWLRGVKAAYMNEVEIVYRVVGIENPFVRHALGLMADLGHGEDAKGHQQEEKHDASSVRSEESARKRIDEALRHARVGFPV